MTAILLLRGSSCSKSLNSRSFDFVPCFTHDLVPANVSGSDDSGTIVYQLNKVGYGMLTVHQRVILFVEIDS